MMSSIHSAYPDWSFPLTPQPREWKLDWQSISERFAWIRALKDCPQDPIFHSEGDVFTHTRMVCEALVSNKTWRALPATQRSIVFAAALMHDIAKPATTLIGGDGRITSPGHGRKGARQARLLLWRDPDFSNPSVPFECREQIAALIRHNSLPLHLLEDAQPPQQRALAASQRVRCDFLALLAEADARGRRCDDQQRLLDNIELFREFCRDNHCYDQPREFASAHSRFVYFRKDNISPAYQAYDTTRFEVILMAGLPASGKDSWINAHLPGLPVISLDALRSQLGVSPSKKQGSVIAAAKHKARAYLRQEQPFVWNATNITRTLRAQLIDLFNAYHARIRIIYLDAPYLELMHRNQTRAQSVPDAVIHKLAAKLELPDMTEAHEVTYQCG